MTGFSLDELVPTWTVATQILKGDSLGHPFRGNQYQPGIIQGRVADIKNRAGEKYAKPSEARSLSEDHDAVARMHRDIANSIKTAMERPFAKVDRAAARQAIQDHRDAEKAHGVASDTWFEAQYSPKSLGQNPKDEQAAAARATESAARASERALRSPLAQAA